MLFIFILVCVCVCACASDASSDHGVDDMLTEGVFEGHQEAVNAMQVHNGLLYTCSGDRTIKAFDLVVGVVREGGGGQGSGLYP